jgi:TPR repeat protein
LKTPLSSIVVLITSILAFVFPAQAEELLSFNNISASVSRDYKCQPAANVRLDTKSEESYRESRVDMQKLSEIVKTYLWLDCKEIEAVNFDGYAEGNEDKIYSATIEKKNDWFLHEVDDTAGVKEKDDAPNPSLDKQKQSLSEEELVEENVKPTNKYSSLESLEAATASSAEAELELAKGLLGLSDKLEGIGFPDDAERGMDILEKLAAEGNPDAIQLLSEAYSSDKKFDLNIPLIEALTGRPMIDGEDQRGTASAMLTLEAAANGSELAVDALQEAGLAGSSMSYYALGMMYLLDKALKMPYESEFLEQQLDMESDVSGSGGSGNVDVGLHFLTLAAENGNAEAQELLSDMDVEFDMPESSGGSSSVASLLLPGASTVEAQEQEQGQEQTQGQANSSSQTDELEDAESGDLESMGEPGLIAANTSPNPASSSALEPLSKTSNSESYMEALIEEGALSDILDERIEAGGSTANSSEPSQAGRHNPSGSKEELTSKNSGLGSNAGHKSSKSTRKNQPGMQAKGHTEYGDMDTEQNEAEIID